MSAPAAKAFAAGADIKEMQSKGYMDMYAADWFRGWEDFTRLRIPVVAAVSGFALGGGCELAMMCDFIIAGDNAKFGQPEINLGVLPGMGGSQRLTRAVGKSKAMDMILTGRFMDADEAERSGLVARVVPAGEDHVHRLGLAHSTGEPLGAAHPREHPQVDFGLAELGVVSGDDEVAHHGQLAAAAQREA